MTDLRDSRLPATTTLNVWIYEDGNPPRQLAHYVELHEYGDPPDKTRLVINDTVAQPVDAYTRGRFATLTRLVDTCNAVGHLRYRHLPDVQFSLSLARWMTENEHDRRVFYYTGRWWRRDLFTEEHWQIARARGSVRCDQREVPPHT